MTASIRAISAFGSCSSRANPAPRFRRSATACTIVFGARVVDSGSMAEMAPWMNVAGSAESGGMLCWQDIVYTELCDPGTMRRVPFGARGTPVYTHLERTSQPMIRLVSGDLSKWEEGPGACGRTYPLLPLGIFGRIDDMFTIRGENVYPSEIDAAMNELADYGGEHQIIISREAAMDELLLKVEAKPPLYEGGAESLAPFRDQTARKMTQLLGLRTKIEIVPHGSLPRTDFKARRVIDDRDLFRKMQAEIDSSRGL